jgi:hypothetical protein
MARQVIGEIVEHLVDQGLYATSLRSRLRSALRKAWRKSSPAKMPCR